MKNKLLLYTLPIYLLFGCTGNHKSHSEEDHNHTEEADHHDEGEEHDHEDHKLLYTAYSEDFEIFAEADAFVKGEESTVLSHLTQLNNFSPLENATVTLRLIIDGKEVVQKVEIPEKKGIYRFDLHPEIAGTGELLYEIISGNETFQITVPDVSVYETDEEAHEAVEAAELPQVNTSTFTKEQSWKIDFATELPKTEPFGQVIKTTGQVQSSQGDEIVISAKTGGIVIFSEGLITEGKSVSNGQVLFSVSGSGFADNNSAVRFAEAKNNYEKASLEYERSKELAKEKIVSEKELQNAQFSFENAKAVYENLNRNFNASGQKVSSPMTGFIKQLFVQNGQYVESGQPIATVSQNKSLVIQAEVQQKYAPVLPGIRSANIKSIYDEKSYSLEELNGKVLSYGKAVNSKNFLIPVNLQIDNKGSFVPGSFVEIYLKTITSEKSVTIPNSALLEEQGINFVYVQINPELFEKREIKTGATDGVKTEILDGIVPDERIVTKGAVFIKLSHSTGALDPHAGHVH